MRFFYTGAKTLLGEQGIPSLSLGGYISSSVVPNNILNGLFSSITQYTIEKDQEEYVMLALKNELGVNIFNLSLTFSLPETNFASFEIASIVNSSNSLFEKINNINSAPYFAEFYSANKPVIVNLGDLDADKYIGIWFKRTLNKTELASLLNNEAITAQTYIDLKKELITLEMTWELDQSLSSSL